MWSAVRSYASWGYFDPGKNDYENGYQCPPVNWGINTPLKRSFFNFVKEVTGATGASGKANTSGRSGR
jgi:hypothetical protein